MCGLGITLGDHQHKAPQAAHDFGAAILDDLQVEAGKTVGSQKSAGEAEAVKGKTQRPAGLNTAPPTSTRLDAKKPSEKRRLGEEDLDVSGSNQHGATSKRAKQPSPQSLLVPFTKENLDIPGEVGGSDEGPLSVQIQWRIPPVRNIPWLTRIVTQS